ncbi:MAG TPA: anti-sigma factor [Candidatus Sulfotelmatobacter sp.]|nr:anti-sigma factor [Candidatus Sulfotelmatobacter sp.]
MSCELTRSILHGYLDGELDAARAAEFERHLLSCPQCVTELEAQESLRSTVQRAGLRERAPEKMRRNLLAALSGTTEPAKTVTPIRPKSSIRPTWWLTLAAAAVFVIVLGSRFLPNLTQGRGGDEMTAAIVDAHLRSLQPGHLEDVISTDQHTVKPWFDGRIDFAPPVHDFVSDGFPLQGGRLDVVRGKTVAVLVYGRRKHIVNVFIWPTSERDMSPEQGSQLGYNWIDWRKGGMELVAISDVSVSDLTGLQKLIAQ